MGSKRRSFSGREGEVMIACRTEEEGSVVSRGDEQTLFFSATSLAASF